MFFSVVFRLFSVLLPVVLFCIIVWFCITFGEKLASPLLVKLFLWVV